MGESSRSHAAIVPLLAWLALVALPGCGSGEAIELLRREDRTPTPAGQAQLYGVAPEVPILAEPRTGASRLGTLRLGGSIERAAEPASTEGCPDGWFAVQPLGFVCATGAARLERPPSMAPLAEGPDLSLPLPYRYGRVRRGGAVVYSALPNLMAQRLAEPDGPGKAPKDRQLGAGSNDVPLDEAGMATGPAVIRPGTPGVGPDGYRTVGAFFAFTTAFDPPPIGVELTPTVRPPLAELVAQLLPETTTLRRRSIVPVVASFDLEGPTGLRAFGLLSDGRFVPLEQLEPALGTAWHGLDLREVGLPVAFTLRSGVRPRRLYGGRSKPLPDEYGWNEGLPLTGRFRTVAGQRHYLTRDRRWVRHKDLILLHRRHRFPDFAAGVHKWVDVSLANQYLVAYEGRKPVYATLISSGRDRLGDPETEPATPQGIFTVTAKHVTADIDGREVEQRYQLEAIPWVLAISGGFSISAAPWLRRLGAARGHHNISLAPVDARWLFHWAHPRLPEGWHSVLSSEDGVDTTTTVYVHK